MTSLPPHRTKVFISYSHADNDWLEKLKRHLKPLVRDAQIECWDDTHIRAGDDWHQEIRTALDAARVAILLVSADFFASNYINQNELPPLLVAAKAQGTRILPVIISACRFARTLELARFQAVNSPDNALIDMSKADQEKMFDSIASIIENLFKVADAQISGTLPLNSYPPSKPRLFGRDQMVEDIVESLLAPSPSPVPILGGPGIGKTTVSLAAFHDSRVADRFGARRFFVRCDPATTADALTGEIARTIGLELGPKLEARVFAWLKEAPAVLMLDNAETPWEADTEGTERLLTDLSCIPGVVLLASVRSRERPLGPAWRETIMVGPLSLDDAKLAFLAIAGAKHSADKLLDTLLGALDGLPLAITLMAHLVEPEPDLSGVWHQWQRERTELLRRPGSMTRLGNIAVSFELSITGRRMTSRARRLLSIAALLPDGIVHDDLNVLLPDEAAKAARVLRAVGLAHDEKGCLRLLAPIREYIAATHPPKEVDLEQAVEHYIGLASTLGLLVGAEGGAKAITRLAANLANIEAMIRLGLAAANSSKAIKAAIDLTRFSIISGYGSSILLEEAGEIARNQNNLHLLPSCIQSLGDFALQRSDYDAARSRYEEALPLYRQGRSVYGEANRIWSLGNIELRRSDYDAAGVRYEEALPLYRQDGSILGEANCIRSLGDIALERSDHGAARAQFETALKLYERIPEPYSIGGTHRRLARIARNDTERRIHVETARKAWVSIDRPDLVQKLDAEFSVPA